jgi:hypothetical protein
MEILKTLDDVEIEERYHVKISNGFATLENLDDDVNINRNWESVRGYTNFSYRKPWSYVLKQHKS